MYEYRDMMAQLKYPGVSRCMSEIYMAANMDEIRYSQESAVPERRTVPRRNDIRR